MDESTKRPACFSCREGEGVAIGREHGITVHAIEDDRVLLVRDDCPAEPRILREGDRLELPPAIVLVAAIGIDGKRRASLKILPRYEGPPEIAFEFRAAPSLA